MERGRRDDRTRSRRGVRLNPLAFEPIAAKRAREIGTALEAEAFQRWIGLRFEEIRRGYARVRLPYRPELLQGGGVVHGGAIASAIDSVVIGAVFSLFAERPRRLATIDLHVHFLDVVIDEDVIAEARVRRQGRLIVFVESDALTSNGREVAHGEVSCRLAT